MIVTLAALEADISPPDHQVFCPGFMQLGRARFHCWRKHGHGWLDMVGAIKHSCDTYFYDLSKKVGIDKISEMATRLGLGSKLLNVLPGERAGLVPTRDWKLGTLGEKWQMGETLITGIGQGFVLATPLQLAVMTARLASGRAVMPRLIVDELPDGVTPPPPPNFASLKLPEHALAIVRRGMNAVANEKRGTAYRYIIREKGFELAGKTGTSQVRRISKRERESGVLKNHERPWHERDHALFIAYAPVDKPRYAISVVVEHGGSGSSTAAPIASAILLETQRRDPLDKDAADRLAAAKPGPGRG
jgi:penicillin-binding protein 2